MAAANLRAAFLSIPSSDLGTVALSRMGCRDLAKKLVSWMIANYYCSDKLGFFSSINCFRKLLSCPMSFLKSSAVLGGEEEIILESPIMLDSKLPEENSRYSISSSDSSYSLRILKLGTN